MRWARVLAVGLSGWITAAATAEASQTSPGAVKLKTSDGLTLSGTEYGTGAKGVVLVHAAGRSATDWAPFAAKLASTGFHVVALDLRGHGASHPPVAAGDADWALMVNDVAAAAGFLRTKGATQVSLVGAELGANLVLNAAAADAEIRTVVLLSPALSAEGVKVSPAIDTYGARPILLVAGADDAASARAAALLEPKARGPKALELLEGAGAGVVMFNRSGGLEGTVIGWLNGSWQTTADGQSQLKAANVNEIETTGTKIEDRK